MSPRPRNSRQQTKTVTQTKKADTLDAALERVRFLLGQGYDEAKVRGFIEGVQFVVERLAPQ